MGCSKKRKKARKGKSPSIGVKLPKLKKYRKKLK